MPRCSVIIPAYNADRYVAAAVRSALAQTYTDIEVIVVNDGSTDGTAEALRPLLDRIVYIEQANRGVSGARNAAIAAAKGELIAPLDADDMWLPERLERMIAWLDAHPDFDVVVTTTGPRRRRPFRTTDQLFWIGQYNFVATKPVIRRAFFEKHGMYDEELRMTEDWELWIRCISAGARIGAVVGVYDVYRRHAGSATADLESQSVRLYTMLERVHARGTPVPGLGATVAVARGRVAVINNELRVARRAFLAAARDRSASTRTRLTAVPFAVAPRLAWRLYRRRIRHFRRKGAKRAAEITAAAGLESVS